jgi:hypothetical protein
MDMEFYIIIRTNQRIRDNGKKMHFKVKENYTIKIQLNSSIHSIAKILI